MAADLGLTGGSSWSWLTFLSYLWPLLFILVAWHFRPVRRFILAVLFFPLALLLFAFGVVAYVLWAPVGWLSDRLVKYLPVERIATAVLDRVGSASRDPLTSGSREEVARQVWPEALYPDLYQPVPEDIERPIHEDGRLLGGIGIVWLADRFVTHPAYLSAARAAFKAALVVFVAVMIYLVFQVVFAILAFVPALLDGQAPVIEQWPGEEPVHLSLWSLITANFGAALADLVGNMGVFALSALATIPLALGAGIAFGLFLLLAWMSAKAEPYRLVTKDADVRWPFRSETRLLLRQTYRQQLALATGYLLTSPTYAIGRATGTLRARGDLAAPMADQITKLDRDSLFQHLLVFGGTGEGKTTAVLKPLMRQILDDWRFGAFIADAKGVLWNDARQVAEEVGRGGDVIVIGTGPDQVGLDPIAGLTPTQVAATLRSVLRQMGGDSKDDFWPEMAANMIRHALTIGKAYALTDAGRAELARTGVNPYSLWWAYQAIIQPGTEASPGPLKTATGSLRAQLKADLEASEKAGRKKDAAEAEAILARARAIHSEELASSITYLEGAWSQMASPTKTGIIANVTQLLDGFSGVPVLRDRFACGKADPGNHLRAALDGKIVLNALSTIEDGLPARLTSILIKTALYREARVRESEFKRMGLGSPQKRPCVVIMDEVQELATVDPASGLSDASFWNVARSTGLSGVFATQTIAALVQAMGREAADNFIQQARSKIFLRTEEQATVEYACWCAGEYERNRVFDDGHRESIEYRTLIDGWDPFHEFDGQETIPSSPRAFFVAGWGLINPSGALAAPVSSRPSYETDTRFIATDGTPGAGGGTGGDSARKGSLQSAQWRAEDLTRQYRMQGNTRERGLTPADIFHMGRWHAFAQIQRAGAVRQDIIRITHDHGAVVAGQTDDA